jgi:transposase
MERDSDQATALRSAVRARRDLVGHRVAAANQLRAHLQIAFPAADGLFAEIDSEITLSFVSRFTTQEQADWLSPRRLGAWLKSVSYSGGTDPEVLHARLLAAPRGQAGPHAAALAEVTAALVAVLRALSAQIKALAASIAAQLAAHPDAEIFQSLPRSGTIRAARLLAEIGDARGRFPTRDSLTCLAGVAPSTRQSGKVKAVTFRWGADKQLRDALCDFAGDSRRASPWAADLYDKAIARGCDHPHAVRILARAWAHIIWRCWQDHAPYDPAAHNSLQTILKQRQPIAT